MIKHTQIILATFFIVFSVFSCVKKDNNNNESDQMESLTPTDYIHNEFNNKKLMDSLITKFIKYGDTLAYKKARNIYFISDEKTSFIFYSLIMSNKYGFKSSYYDIYYILTTSDKNSLDNKTSKMADYYLLKAYEKGSQDAKKVVEKKFGDLQTFPHSDKYWMDINK